MSRVALAAGRVATVGDVNEVFPGQLGLQRFEDAQPANALSNAPMAWRLPRSLTVDGSVPLRGRFCVAGRVMQIQALITAMSLNSPLAMRFCHSAGPVLCTLVPLASTATVTGMSTTSNS